MDLKKLGLSNYEEKAYKTLIKLGKSTASEISREGNLSYGKIYEVLALLERKGLVKTIPEKSKKFIPSDPTQLLKLVEEEESELKLLREEIKTLKQVYEIHEEEIVHIVKGKRNFYQILRSKIPPKTFEYQIKYTAEFNPEWAREDKKSLKRGVDLKTLTKFDEETEKNVKKWLKINKNIKEFQNKGIAIDLTDSEIIIALIKNNIILSIKDISFIDLMKNLFLNSYHQAKPIKFQQHL